MSPSRCPGELALWHYVRSPDTSPDAAHIADCTSCAAKIAAIREDRSEFAARVFPATQDEVLARARAPRLRWWWALPVPVLAAAALLLVPRPKPAEENRLRGDALSLAVFQQRDGTLVPLASGDAVEPGAVLRLQIRAPLDCELNVLSADRSGQLSPLFPAEGQPATRQTERLELAAQLDEVVGQERLIAVCAPTPEAFQQARSRLAEGAPSPPAGVLQAVVTLEKRASARP